MKKINLLSIALLIIGITTIKAQTGNVGIGTNTPQAKLHVNGEVRIDSLKSSSNANQVLVLDTATKNIALMSYPSITVGDIKQGFQSNDHTGWIKLDGRAVSTLTAQQQIAANSLGFAVNLPDATNTYLSQNGATLGNVSSSNAKTITQANLPNVTLSGSTSNTGGHSHAIGRRSNPDAGAYDPSDARRTENSAITSDRGYLGSFSSSSEGNHTHTITTSSINGGVAQQSLDITPKTLSVNTFIYLGN